MMKSSYRQAKRLGHEHTIERMKLLSMIPLNVSAENSSKLPQSQLDVKMSSYQNTISSYTKSIDCMVSVDTITDKNNKYEFDAYSVYEQKMKNDQFGNHQKTPFKPQFIPKKHENPSVGTYTPQFETVLTRSPNYSLPRNLASLNDHNDNENNSGCSSINRNKKKNSGNFENNDENNNKSMRKSFNNSQKERPKSAFSTADLLYMYNENIREYDIDGIEYPKYDELELDESKNISSILSNTCCHNKNKGSLCFKDSGERNIFENKSPAKHLIAMDPIEPLPPPVPIFDRQKERKLDANMKVDSQRDYQNASKQLDKVKPRVQQCTKIDNQISRYRERKENSRVQFLDKINQQQKESIEKYYQLSKLKENKTPRKVSTGNHSTKKNNFDTQRPRSQMVFPGGKVAQPDPKLPFNPIESYKKTLARTRITKIKEGGKELPPELFWKPF